VVLLRFLPSEWDPRPPRVIAMAAAPEPPPQSSGTPESERPPSVKAATPLVERDESAEVSSPRRHVPRFLLEVSLSRLHPLHGEQA
jgi:hypothetical protein